MTKPEQEFNLSENELTLKDLNDILPIDDIDEKFYSSILVKEFIKRLKAYIDYNADMPKDKRLTIYQIINKLAGEKLI